MTDTLHEQYAARHDEIRERLHAIHEEYMEVMQRQFASAYDSAEWHVCVHRLDELTSERRLLNEEQNELWKKRDAEIEQRYYGYSRPTGWFANLLNKGLGALPEHSRVIEPDAKALGSVKSYRLLAFFTLSVAVAMLLALVYWVPGMAWSPYSVFYYLAYWLTGNVSLASFGAILMSLVAFHLLQSSVSIGRSARDGKFLDNAAMWEEHWFRAGCETWTWRQRIYSCAAFGLVHVMNIIYPLASILVVGVVVGGMSMAVYLAEHRRSDDSVKATLAATKFHATYNRFAVVYMVIALGLVVMTPFLS